MISSRLLFIVIACGCAVLLFQTSQSVQNAEAELAKLERENTYQHDSIQVLSAEWDYLNNPVRLERLIRIKQQENERELSPLFHQPVSNTVMPAHKPPFIFETGGTP